MPRRRGKRGSGTVIQRDGKYQAQWSGGLDGNGKRIRKSATFVLEGDAEWWLQETMRAGEAPADLTLGEWLDQWLRLVAREVDDSTLTSYTGHVELHIRPMLGRVRLRALTVRQVDALIADREQHVSKRKRPLSPTTVRSIVTTLSMALEAAKRKKLIPDNPARDATRPRKVDHRVEPMTDEDADRILDVLVDSWLGPLARLLMGSGLRLGEALALDQRDLKHDRAEPFVQLRDSKTDIRAVPITEDAAAALRDALAVAPRRGGREPVFFGPRTGERLRGDTVTHAVPRIIQAAGLARLTPHGFRHGLATMMLAHGASLPDIQHQLGHRSLVMARRYAHVTPSAQRLSLTAAARPIRERQAAG